MKKLVQIVLVLVLILGLFQFVGSEPLASASSPELQTNTVVEDAHAAACLAQGKLVICFMPQVGWNT
jgi:hypothetical protein